MHPDRTPQQVIEAAAAMDRARAAGLPDEVLVTLLAARAAWWGEGAWPATVDLTAVLVHPTARDVDRVLWQAIRRRVSGA